MPIYNYKCLYCGNCDLSLAGLDDHMTLCSQCGNLMLRLDDDFFWQSFEKDHLQFTAEAHYPSAPANGANTFEGKIPIRLNPGKCRLTQSNKLTPKADVLSWRESTLLLAFRAKILCDKKLGKGKRDPQKPKSLDIH
jgi:hypothetical protein